MSNFVSTVNR